MECYCNLNHGTERRIIDDMSEIDVQLQKQTSEVSAIEMTQEADIIKKTTVEPPMTGPIFSCLFSPI